MQMLNIKYQIPDNYYKQGKEISYEKFKDWMVECEFHETLMNHELHQLNQLFQDVLKIPVTKDILLEKQEDYIKYNLTRILYHYILKTWKSQYINLKDKFHKCKKCFNWFYFPMKEKDVCKICYDDMNRLEVDGIW